MLTLPLDDDIIDRILTFCTDFDALNCAFLISKQFHRVFEAHPKSIIEAVAYNIVGPALPSALRVLRYPSNLEEGVDPIEMATTCPENREASKLTVREKKELLKLSKIVQSLEDVYSLLSKDRTSSASVLTSAESHRFQRATYRAMLYSRLFPHDQYDSDTLSDDAIAAIHKQRTAVLDVYPTQELRELHSLVNFMKVVLNLVLEKDVEGQSRANFSLIDMALSTGPAGVLRAWKDHYLETLEEGYGLVLFENAGENKLFAKYFSLPFDNIWASRNLDPLKLYEPSSHHILDKIIGEDDTCSQCGAPGGLGLLTEANWGLLKIHPFAYQLLPGHLRLYEDLGLAFARATYCTSRPETLGPWIAGIFAVRDPSMAEWTGWEQDLSYCEPCLRRFLVGHVWRWFLAEQLKSGWTPPPENCPYGYDCYTQLQKVSHAKKKNHFCAPIMRREKLERPKA